MKALKVTIICMLIAHSLSAQYSIQTKYTDSYNSSKISTLSDSIFFTTSLIEGHFIAPSVILLTVDILNPPKQFSETIAASLSIQNIPQIDRAIINFDTMQAAIAAKWSDNLNLLSFGISAAVILSSPKNKAATINNVILYVEGAMLTYGITEVLKSSVSRVRPYAYNESLPESYRFREDVTSSFPSGHTSSTAYNCFFAAKVLSERYIADDNIALKTITWVTAATIPAITGYLRTEAGKHFYTDVAAGYAIGALIGYVVPALHQLTNNDVSFFPIAAPGIYGLGISMEW